MLKSAKNSKDGNQTFSISLNDSFSEYLINPDFRQLIDCGNFIYINGRYVIDDPKYVMRSPAGTPHLTDYASQHINECCVRFYLGWGLPEKTDATTCLSSLESRKTVPESSNAPVYRPDTHNTELFDRSEDLRRLHTEYAEEKEFLNRPAFSFAQAAWAHIGRLNISRKEFCERTLLSEKTYERLRDGTANSPSLQTVVQICVGLGLGGVFGEQLLELAGYKLSTRQLAYKKVLCSCRGHSIYECDEILTALGMPSIIPKQYRATG
jgi:hypothetical protein